MQVYNALQLKKGAKVEQQRMGSITQPLQFIPKKEKDDEWAAWNLDWLEWNGLKQIRRNARRLMKNYKLAKGMIDRSDYIIEENNEYRDVVEILTRDEVSALELKFYPIILLGLLLASRRIKNTTTQIIFGLLVLISSTGSIIYTLRGELNHTAYSPLSASLSEGYWRTFGVTVPPYLGIKTINDLNILESKIHFSRIQVQSFGFLIIVVVALILLFFHSRGKVFGPNVSLIIEEGTLRSIVLLFSLCLTCISYFLLSSYDYRMIYAVPLFLIGLAQESEKRKNKLIGYFVYGILFIMWAQIFIWTSALAQAPILVSFVLVLFNIRRALISDFLSFKGLKKSEILRF